MASWERAQGVLAGSPHRASGLVHHPAIHAAGSSSNNSLVIALSLVLFAVLVLLAVQINPVRLGTAAFRRRRTAPDRQAGQRIL